MRILPMNLHAWWPINIRNEVVNNSQVDMDRSQEALKMLSFLQVNICCNCFFKKHRYSIHSCTYNIPDTNCHWMASAIVLPFLYSTLILQSLQLNVSVIF
jgi:hypothetical protein